MASVARSRADGEGQMVPRTPARGTPGADAYRFCVNWNGMLEPLELPKGCTVAQLLSVLKSGKYAKDAHKFVVFKGLLLTNPTTLAQAGIRDGSVLHLLLNDDPYRGKPLFIKTLSGRTRSVSCGPDFYIEDVKEELSYYPGELTAEKTRLVYAGRLLQNQHTLREYNIQKPSLLLALGPPAEGRQLSTFVAGVYPRRDQCQVKSNAQLSVRFHTAEVNDTHFFGQLLGAPDLSSLTNKDIKVYKCGATDVQIAGELMVDLDDNSFTWVPLRPLQAATRYTVYLNKQEPAPAADAQSGITAPSFGLPLPGATKGSQSAQSSFRHSRASEPVQGEVTWDFFTEGYEPMRITAIYPRPHTRVRHDTVVIILGFSGSVHPGCNPNRWVSLRGHDLSPPLWDASSKSLIYKLAQPLRPNEIVRVSVREHLIRGSKGESVYPIQQDGMIRTSAFRWKFYTAEESKYELQNAFSCGVSPVLERLRNGQIPTLAAQSQVLLDMVGEQNRLSQSVGLALDPDTGRMISRSVMQSEETQHALGWHMLDPTGLLGIGVRNMSQNMVEAPEPAAAHKDALHDETPPMPSTPKMAVNSPPPAMYSAVPRKSNNATEWIF